MRSSVVLKRSKATVFASCHINEISEERAWPSPERRAQEHSSAMRLPYPWWVRRVLAVLATVAAVLGASGLFASVSGLELFRYVSEAGVTGAPHARLYHASVWLIALALALLAGATRELLPVLALAVAALAAAISGTARCSPGCPLPPYETPTASDLTHAIATIVALLLCGLLMLWYWREPVDSGRRRAAWAGLTVAAPLLVATAASMLFIGRGHVSGGLERLALITTSIWLIATCAAAITARE
jgi:hypothetical protein